MVQIPYTPVPNAKPIPGTGAGPISVNTPGAAFGENIARAVESIGGNLDKAGDEMYARAQATQQLNNETAAKAADAQYSLQADKAHLDFMTNNRGLNAATGLEAHTKGLEELRQNIRASLPNDAARKMFDSQSLSTLGRNVFSAGAHASTESLHAANEAANARIDVTKSNALQNAQDEVGFNRWLNQGLGEIDQQAQISGADPVTVAHDKAAYTSSMWANRITGLARTDQISALGMLNKAVDDKKLMGQDIQKVTDQVQSQMINVASRNISDSTNGGWEPYMKVTDADRARGVEPTLLSVVKRAQQILGDDQRFTIGNQGGTRTPAEQAALVKAGYSQTYNSNHLTGRAIDLVPMGPDGKPDYNNKAGFVKIEGAMRQAERELGIPVTGEHDKISSWDPGHYSLARDYDVRDAPKLDPPDLNARADRAYEYALKLDPTNPKFAEAVRARVIGDFTTAQTIKRNADYNNKNTVLDAVFGGLPGGKIPTTIEELQADPKTAQAWDALDPAHRMSILNQLKNNAKGDRAPTIENFRRWQQLKGLSQGDDAERAAFLNMDLTKENLPFRDMRELSNLQLEMVKGKPGNPIVTRMMSGLEGDMRAAGIFDDKDKKAEFRGAVSSFVEDFMKEKSRPPNPQEMRDMGAQLLQQTNGGTWWKFWQGHGQAFNVPDDKRDAIIESLRTQKGIQEPSEEQIRRVWNHDQFMRLYGPKGDSGG